jgi:hypothetical protein
VRICDLVENLNTDDPTFADQLGGTIRLRYVLGRHVEQDVGI